MVTRAAKDLLKNTMNSVDFHNRVLEEQEMWKQWELERGLTMMVSDDVIRQRAAANRGQRPRPDRSRGLYSDREEPRSNRVICGSANGRETNRHTKAPANRKHTQRVCLADTQDRWDHSGFFELEYGTDLRQIGTSCGISSGSVRRSNSSSRHRRDRSPQQRRRRRRSSSSALSSLSSSSSSSSSRSTSISSSGRSVSSSRSSSTSSSPASSDRSSAASTLSWSGSTDSCVSQPASTNARSGSAREATSPINTNKRNCRCQKDKKDCSCRAITRSRQQPPKERRLEHVEAQCSAAKKRRYKRSQRERRGRSRERRQVPALTPHRDESDCVNNEQRDNASVCDSLTAADGRLRRRRNRPRRRSKRHLREPYTSLSGTFGDYRRYVYNEFDPRASQLRPSLMQSSTVTTLQPVNQELSYPSVGACEDSDSGSSVFDGPLICADRKVSHHVSNEVYQSNFESGHHGSGSTRDDVPYFKIVVGSTRKFICLDRPALESIKPLNRNKETSKR